ncbi:hypothetical protein JKP88DRAFT_354363 [Tribonema minus]|uniref:Proteasome assembly chaperone 3 n=1 Tax=Tribonema minus TaxID=303371 RepID=A0A835YZP5_9STRA|nr:hypothetical protein JKP88DRAFT_354363 [Tribonema minus]
MASKLSEADSGSSSADTEGAALPAAASENAATTEAEVQHREPLVKVTHLSESHAGTSLIARVVALSGCCYVWVGEGDWAGSGKGGRLPEQGAVAAAVQTPYEAMPVVTELLGEEGGFGGGMAQRLAKRTGQMVYASVNVSNAAAESLPMIERRVLAVLQGAG